MNCIIYIPGLGYNHYDISVEAYAQRYAVSLDRTHTNKHHKYTVESSSLIYGLENEYESKVATVFELGINGEKRLVTRIFECHYHNELTQRFTSRNLFIRSGLLFWALWKKLPAIILPPKSKRMGSSKKGRFQIAYFSAVFMMVALFGIFTIPSTISLVAESWGDTDTAISFNGLFGDSQWVEKITIIWKVISRFIVATSSALLFLFPGVMSFIESMAVQFLCLDYYLNYSDNHLNIMGKIESLYEKVAEEEKYEGIELHGYSFGGILILDLLFPYSESVNERLKNETTHIVTIGCPYHFIERYYPRYFNGRKQTELKNLKSWINIHSSIDVMSSILSSKNLVPFLSHLPVEVKNKDFDIITEGNIGMSDYIMFIGLRAHTMYWGEDRNARNSLTLLHQEKSKKTESIPNDNH